MKKNNQKDISYCGHCHRELPVEAFYTDHSTQKPDRYCIACRKEISRTRYRELHSENKKHKYPVITEINDRQLRITLIKHALKTVNESLTRKQQQQRELDYLHDL